MVIVVPFTIYTHYTLTIHSLYTHYRLNLYSMFTTVYKKPCVCVTVYVHVKNIGIHCVPTNKACSITLPYMVSHVGMRNHSLIIGILWQYQDWESNGLKENLWYLMRYMRNRKCYLRGFYCSIENGNQT